MAHLAISANTAWSVLNFRKNLIETLLAQGHQVTVIAPDGPEGDDLRELGCDFVPVSIDRRGSSALRDLRFLRDLKRIFLRIKPDAIISYTIKNNIYGAHLARRLNIPFLPVVTGLGSTFVERNILGWIVVSLYRRAFRDIQRVCFLNQDDGKVFVDRGILRPEQVQILPSEGIDVEHFQQQPLRGDRPRRFIYCGRILRQKGVPEYLAAARQLKAKRDDCTFDVLGFVDPTNPDSVSDEELRDLDAQGIINYLGPAKDVRRYLTEAHCVVLPTYYREGVPRVLMEAAAIGRPIITTDTVGCQDVVDDGDNGFFCIPQDADDLARQIERIADAPLHRLKEMGEAGRRKMVDEFRDEIVIEYFRRWLAGVL